MKSNRIRSFQFQRTTWQESSNDILDIRHRVFMIEQHIRDNVLCDLDDNECFHVVVKNTQGDIVACGRITEEGRIGRLAVLLPYRGMGIGTKLFKTLIDIGKSKNLKNISLNAELGDQRFYNMQQFTSAGPVYMKQGVPHQMLARKLA
ncbi:MAG: GNAT family N-acetyltransferase [Kangiellaceae bacterium]|jgi:predicted GNAT family N-acyltransferase